MSRARLWQASAYAVCLVTGLLFAVSYNTAKGFDLRGGRNTELSGLIRDSEARVREQNDRLTALRRELELLERAEAGSDVRVRAARSDAERLRSGAGLQPVHGRGLTVVLSDAPRGPDGRYPVGAQPDDLVVHQQDLQSVLNALWSGGAEAVSVADQRLVATSAVRCVGNTLLLHGRTYSPPYTITVIGDQDRMAAALNLEPGVRVFRQYVQAFGLGYRVERKDDVSVPGYTGPLRLDKAQEVPR
ncbi:DUF881 domain-containing protein [Pseudonocardiaceae bacterium YIM PH 21723]|nr:DUF881 domain-containing protein [Pseudonocardiaceae bacterium YIM PH 21723]